MAMIDDLKTSVDKLAVDVDTKLMNVEADKAAAVAAALATQDVALADVKATVDAVDAKVTA